MVRLECLKLARGIAFPVAPSSGGGYLKKNHKSIRLALKGCANRPFYHIVITNRWRPRDAQPYEQLGTYDPMPNADNQKLVSLNLERIRYWIGRGALFSPPMCELLGLAGFLPLYPRTVQNAWRSRKAAAAAKAEEEKNKESASS